MRLHLIFEPIHENLVLNANANSNGPDESVLLDFSLTVKAAPHECETRTSQP